jgi:MFS family permease
MGLPSTGCLIHPFALGNKLLLPSSFLLWSIFYVGLFPYFLYNKKVQFIFVGLFFLGLLLGLVYSIALTNTMKMAGKKRGYYAGIFESTCGIGYFVGPGIGGIIANIWINYVFVLPSIVTASYIIVKSLDDLKTLFLKRTKNIQKNRLLSCTSKS